MPDIFTHHPNNPLAKTGDKNKSRNVIVQSDHKTVGAGFTRQKKKQTEEKPAPTKASENQPSSTPSLVEKTTAEDNLLGPFATFIQNPEGVALAGQNQDEKTILFLRADFFTNFPWIFNTILFAPLPFLLFPLLDFANISLDFFPARFNFLLITFYYFLLIGYVLANFVTWFYTMGIVTDKKAFDIDFNNLSSINVSTVNLPDASDAKYSQRGFFQSFFDYGDVTITIEATKEKLVFEKAPRPALVADIVGDVIGKA